MIGGVGKHGYGRTPRHRRNKPCGNEKNEKNEKKTTTKKRDEHETANAGPTTRDTGNDHGKINILGTL